MDNSLSDRVASYIDISDPWLLPKVPVVIILNGRSFSKATSLLTKPYDPEFVGLMTSAMVKLCQEADGTVFAYTFNDQIILVLRNDQHSTTEPWYGNRQQAIVSAAAAIASLEFKRVADERGIRILGDPIFIARAFVVPTISELTNVIIHMQQNCFHTSLSHAAFYELWKEMGTNRATDMLEGKSSKQKAAILQQQCGIEFNNYPTPFKRGVAAYRVPKFNPKTKDIKHKLTLNDELPLFSQDRDWLSSLLKTGTDTLSVEHRNGEA